VHEPAPDYDLTFDPKSFSIPRGGRVSLTVTAARKDDFDGPIEVEVINLPPGITATKGVIPAGGDSIVLALTASEDASLEGSAAVLKSMYSEMQAHRLTNGRSARTRDLQARVPGVTAIKLVAKARIKNRDVTHDIEAGEPVSVVALAPKPDLVVKTEGASVTLIAGQSAAITVKIERHNGFTGRIPISVMNLPHGVRVDDIGLNGIMITEHETSRTFHIVAEPWVAPTSQPVLIVGRVEVNSPLRNEAAAEPIELVIQSRDDNLRAGQRGKRGEAKNQ
jgi:hypothetical protein